MKRFLALTLVLLLVLAMAGCNTADNDTAGTDSAAPDAGNPVDADPTGDNPGGEKFRIAVSLPPTDNSWMAKLLELLEEECKNDTDQFEYTVKSAVDNADQQNTLETFRQGGHDLIIVLPGDSTLMEQICEEIYNDGIPTIILDRVLDSELYTAYVGGDNYASAAAAAEYLGQALGGEGNVAVLRNWVGTPADLLRFNGFVETLEANYPNINVVREVEGENSPEKGYEATSNILTAVDQLDAVYAQVDESGIGAVTAIQNAGRTDVRHVVGIGGAQECFDMILEDGVYTGVATYLPTMGAEAVKLARSILRGEDYEKNNVDPPHIVTIDNVEEFYALGF